MPRVCRVLYFSDVTSAEEHTTHAARLCREGKIEKKEEHTGAVSVA